MTHLPGIIRWCLTALLAAALPAERIPQTVSPEAPDRLVLQDLGGEPRRLTEYQGKVIVLNFWATWCEPCREEMPLLIRVQHRFGRRGVLVIGASADEESTQAQIPGFIRNLGITFLIWKGATTEHMRLLGLGDGLPATVVIDREGRLAFRILGILDRRELEQRLEFLLTGRQGPPPEPLVDRVSGASEKAHPHRHGDRHEDEESHSHGGVGMEGASTVPS